MALKGAILGDICGSQYEFRRPKDLDYKNCELFTDRCTFTDDTVMSIATGMWLADDNWPPEVIDRYKEPSEYYLNYGQEYKGVGYGSMFEDWLESNGTTYNKSFGNGCAMRVSPITMFSTLEQDIISEASWTVAATHNHPESIKGAITIALCSLFALQGGTKEAIYEYVLKQYPSSEYTYGVDRPIDDYRNTYQWSAFVQDSVPVAIRCFLESDDYESFLRNVLSLPCDTDTIAAIGGGIAEDYYGKTFDNASEILKRYLPQELLADIDHIYCNSYYYKNKYEPTNNSIDN